MDFVEIKEKNDRRKELAESMRKAKEQWAYMRKCVSEDADTMTAAARFELERVREGGIDFTLFNYILYTISYKDCTDAQRSCQRTYEGVHPYLMRFQKQNKILRDIAYRLQEHLSDEDMESFKEIMDTPEDMVLWAKEQLGELKSKALARSKTGIYDEKGKQLRLEN
jgi:hypothetical protein